MNIRPAIGLPDPYPQRFARVAYVRQETDLVIARLRERIRPQLPRETEYVLARDFSVLFEIDGAPRVITAPAGMLTDLATTRWPASMFIDRVGPHLEAAVLHDFLCIAWQDLEKPRPPRRTDFDFANAAMMAMLRDVPLSPALKLGIRKVIGSKLGLRRFNTPNPPPRYIAPPI